MAFKMKGPMFFGSAIKKYGKKSEPVAKMKKKDGDAVMMKKDGVKPDYPDIDGDGNTSESMKQAAADKKGSGINYGKKMKPVAKMGHGEDDEEKGGPKMKDKNPAPKMNYDKKKKQGKSLNQVNINQK